LDRFYQPVKRGLDLVLAGLALGLLWPVLLAISLAVLLEDGRPVFFTQERIGKRARRFRIFKFRTMVKDADKHGPVLSEDDPRITRVGRFLRRWSLDELPQLVNVILGHMSIVGPRPTLEYQVARYSLEQMQRLCVRPGITGLAQVSGRNHLSWQRKIELDLEYVRKASFWLDIKILLKTLPVVLKGGWLYRPQQEWQKDPIAAPEMAKEKDQELLKEVKS